MAARSIIDDNKGYSLRLKITKYRLFSELLTDLTLQKIAGQISNDQLELGLHLDISLAEIKQINKSSPPSVEATLLILKTWRERTGIKSEKEQLDELEEALREIGRNDLLPFIDRPDKTADDWAVEGGHKEAAFFLESLSAGGTAAAVASVTSVMAASNITDDSKGYKVVSDKTLHRIARMIGGKRVALGLELDLEYAEVETLQCKHSDPVDLAFHILMTWRERTGNKSEKEQVDALEEALREIGRNDLQSYIGR